MTKIKSTSLVNNKILMFKKMYKMKLSKAIFRDRHSRMKMKLICRYNIK